MGDTNTNIALITKYSTDGFDKVYKMEACSSVLAKDSDMVKFTSAKTVRIAKMAFGGLSNYYRNNYGDDRVDFGGAGNAVNPADGANPDEPYYGNGYRGSAASLTWEDRTIRMDRSAKYIIEKFDDEESGGLMVGKGLTEINRTQIVPEVDAYCFSEIYKNAGHIEEGRITTTVGGQTVDAPLMALNNAFTYLGKNEVPDENQVIFMSFDYINALRNTPELTKFMQQGDYEKDVNFKMTSYEGRKLILVPPSRFKTSFTFGEGGYWAASDAQDIDFIVMPKDAAIHVVKFQQTKVLSDNFALAISNMDGYVLLARIYHDCFVLDNKKVGIYAHTKWFSSASAEGSSKVTVPELVVNLALKTTTGTNAKVQSLIAVPGDKPYTLLRYSGSALTVSNIVLGNSGTKVAATTTTNSSTSKYDTVAFGQFIPVSVGDIIDCGASNANLDTLYVMDGRGVLVGNATAASGILSISKDGAVVEVA